MDDIDDDPQDITQGAMNYMKRAAPERATALQKLFDEHQIRIRHSSLDEFRQGEIVDPSPSTAWETIQYPPVMHTIAWLLAHGGWEAMRNYGAAILSFQIAGGAFNGVHVEQALSQLPDTMRCDEAIDCAINNVRGSNVDPPGWLPNISDGNSDPEIHKQYGAVRELWLIAQTWFLLHEMHHVIFTARATAFADHPAEELACDLGATKWLLDGVDCYSEQQPNEPAGQVRGKRSMGIVVGLFCIGFLSDTDGSQSHPPLTQRIAGLFNCIGAQDAGLFWEFAVGLLFVLAKDRQRIEFQKNMTTRQIAITLANCV